MERSFVMKRNILRGGVGALLLSAVLGIPGIASAEPAEGPARVSAIAEQLAPGLWSFLSRLFLDGQAPPPGQTGSGGGEGSNGGGAMDPNGGASGAQPHQH
jgi:hypothetical protein